MSLGEKIKSVDGCQQVTERIIGFLEEIGIGVRYRELPDDTFLPGIMPENGTLVVDRSRLKYPGDLLHEAGHLAVIPAEQRARCGPSVGADLGEEIGAQAWSWAALFHLRLDPAVVFHGAGYQGWSQAFIENFSQGRYVGVPLLQWMGLTADGRKAPELGVPPYPHMVKWLRD